jgi:AMIN domain
MMKFVSLERAIFRKEGKGVAFKAGRSGGCGVRFFCLKKVAFCALMFGSGVQLIQAGQQAATIRHIAVTGDDKDLGIEITASKPIIPRAQTVTGPDRLIVDLPDARPDAGLRKVPINRGKLRDVRVGLLSANPPVTRVVMDLAAPTEYHVSPLANTIVVKLGNESAVTPAPIALTTNPPVEAKPAETVPAVAIPQQERPSQRSWTHWIMPILVTTSVVAMLVISLVVRIQNSAGRRGL